MGLTHFSLFTGIAGIDLAAEWAGFKNIGQVEKNKFCQEVLTERFPNVPAWSDIEDVTEESVREKIGDRRICLLSGGPPCQPFSTIGKQRGSEDDRNLWPEMFRVVRELRPDWVLGENVANFANMGLDKAVSHLEGEGYEVRTFEIPAVAVNAEHRRMRVFIVGNSTGQRWDEGRFEGKEIPKTPARRSSGRISAKFPYVRNTTTFYEPPFCRRYDGFPDRVDRIKSLGNAVVPQQVYPILRGIAEIERGIRE